MHPRTVAPFALLRRFVRSLPVALTIPPQSREGVRESGWRLGLSAFESPATTPLVFLAGTARASTVPSGLLMRLAWLCLRICCRQQHCYAKFSLLDVQPEVGRIVVYQ